MRSLTVSLLVVVVVSIFGLGWGLDSLFSYFASDAEDDTNAFMSIASDMADTLNSMSNPKIFVDQWQSKDSASVNLQDLSNFPVPETIASSFLAGEPLMLESELGISANFYLAHHDQVFSMDNIYPADKSRWWLKAALTSLFYIGTLLLVLLWLKPLLMRLRNLRNATDEFGAGNLDSRVSAAGLSYIADIERKYNHMAEQIQTLVEDNKLLTSAVSHDLRTPLARLRFGTDTLFDADDPAIRRKYQKRITADLNEMEALVDSLLRYAKLDSVMNDIDKQELSLQNLIQECASQYLDESILVKVRDNSAENKKVYGSYEHLATMTNNLLQNAVAHATTQVIIEVNYDNNTIQLTVSDDGPGMPATDREKLLKPFQRGEDSARTGYGLGLAVVSRIATHHGAELSIGTSSELGGAQFSILFSD